MKTLTLKYNEAVALMTIMTSAKLSGVRNIQRGRCLRLLKTECKDFEEERQRLLTEEHCELGEDGKPIEVNGNLTLKNGKAWNDAYENLVESSPITLPIATDTDKGWLKLCKEVMTTKLCPEIDGAAAMDFEDVLDAINLATEEPKKSEEAAE
jgi:hypothetical protein